MTKRIHNINKWKQMQPGKGLQNEGLPNRLVRIEFNTMLPAAVMLVDGDKHVFLGRVDGLDAIEFRAPKALIHILADSEGDVWYFTNDGRSIEGNVDHQVTFTDIMSREKRNPQQDLMMWQMQQNAKRRELQLLAEIQRRDDAEAQRVAANAAAEAKASADAKAADAKAAKAAKAAPKVEPEPPADA